MVGNRIFQLDHRHEALALAGREMTVREKLDGTIQLVNQGHKLQWKELAERPGLEKVKEPVKNNQKWKPAANHPWNRDSARKVATGGTLAPAAPPRESPHEVPSRVTVLSQQKA